MNGKQKLFLLILGMIMIAVAVRFGLNMLGGGVEPVDVTVTERTTEEEITPDEPKQKEYVNVFFIGQNENHEEVYKAVKRVYDADIDGSKLKFAINSLVTGPKLPKKQRVFTQKFRQEQVLYISRNIPIKLLLIYHKNLKTAAERTACIKGCTSL